MLEKGQHSVEHNKCILHCLPEEPVDDAARDGGGEAAAHQVDDGQRGLVAELGPLRHPQRNVLGRGRFRLVFKISA